MSNAVLLIKNLFKLGLIALQYGIVKLNLDMHSIILSDFVVNNEEKPIITLQRDTQMKSETPKVNELSQQSIPPTKRENITMESDAPPYVGNSDNMRAFSHKDKNKLHEWLP